MPSTFTVHEVGAGVWAAIAPGTSGPAVSNAAIVDLGDKTLVVDTFMTVRAAEELALEAKRLTGRPVGLVVNSHWHSDHVRGNRVFAEVPIIGTALMNELMVADAPNSDEEFDERAAGVRSAASRMADFASTEPALAAARATAALAEALESESGSYRLVLPDLLIESRLVVEGERSATVIHCGRGHTQSDLVVHLPDTGILIAGDLVWAGVHPKTNDGFVKEWSAGVGRLAELGASVIVPGHGEIAGPAELTTMGDYLQELDTMVHAVRRGDLDPSAAPPPLGAEDWADIGRFRAGLSQLATQTAVP